MNGVVHVGGHCGEEVDGYLDQGRSPIICFEPQTLPRKHRQSPDVIWISFALGDVSGICNLHIPAHIRAEEGMDTQCASLLYVETNAAVAAGWTITPVDTVRIPVVRFDEWADAISFTPENFSLLAIDTNGTEMAVLDGFGRYLDGFKELIVECSCPPLFQGGHCTHHIQDWLQLKGFRMLTPMCPHGDMRFVR